MTARCPHCHARTPTSPSRFARASVLGIAWLVVTATVFLASVIGPLVIVTLPFMLFGGLGLIAAAYEYAHGDRICAACGKIYEIEGVRLAPVPSVEIEIESAPALAA